MSDIIKLKVADNDLVVKPRIDEIEEVTKVIEVPIPSEDLDSVLNRSITDITTGVEELGTYALAYCTKLKSIKGDNVKVLGDNALYECISLTDIDFPNLRVIKSSSLRGCPLKKTMVFPELTTMKTVYFDDSVVETLITPKLTSIEGRNFYRSRIKQFEAPLLEVLPDYFMYEAYSMKTAIFPNCTEAGSYAFYSCGASIIDLGHPTNIGYAAFDYVSGDVYIRTPTLCTLSGSVKYFRGKFFVPAELVEQYKNAPNWSDWANRIFAIEEE